MKFFRRSFAMLLTLAAALSFTACSDDSLVGEGAGSTGGDGRTVFLNAAIALPSSVGTRSQTDSTGVTNSDAGYNKDGVEQKPDTLLDYEYGYDYENDVRTMLLVITNKKDEYITHTLVKGITQAPTTARKFDFITTAEVEHKYLEAAYKEGGLLADSKDVRIYVYCNYTDRVQKLFDEYAKNATRKGTEWLDWAGEVEEGPSLAGQTPTILNTIWAPRSFLMTNAQVFDVKFPESINDWDKYADENSPFDLSIDGQEDKTTVIPIYVERAAARIDFRDASELGSNTYGLTIIAKQVTNNKPAEDVPEAVDDDDDDDVAEGDVIYTPYNIKLTRMSLVNMSKNFYYMRRVSDDGYAKSDADDNGFEYLGKETTKNYVVDTDADLKSKQNGINLNNVAAHFNFTAFQQKVEEATGDTLYNRAGWYTDNIDDVLDRAEDTWSGSYRGNKPYHIWRYVTENTIPAAASAGETLQQKNIQSIGVVFKGSIKLGKDYENAVYPKVKDTDADEYYVSEAVRKALKAVENGKTITKEEGEKLPVLYMFENLLYANVGDLVAGAIREGQGSTLWGAVNTVLANWKLNNKKFEYNPTGDGKVLNVIICDSILNGKSVADDDVYNGYTIDFAEQNETGDIIEKFRRLAPKSYITVYKASNEEDGEGWGYYCYYFYWNRHNDNLLSGRMGRMEFATVRNNVYKLGITSIKRFGHPRVPGYDPEPPTPDTYDEPEKDYLRVHVEVLPWVVRVNDITF